ncbi:2924_t:CDS:2 [Racocetra persica]|uniref:2924_t:CDS:1 n=1 Tax=Racocetra persica TaxID=160502 RepID=A0ACA9L7N3_9GLOM|nr:2924_t:CDS:2 [Racocetra persica]
MAIILKGIRQSDDYKINPNDTVLEETKTLTSRDIEKGICEKCGITNHQEKEEENVNITVFSDGTETKAFCDDCLGTIKIET